jgi:hypothetical protein
MTKKTKKNPLGAGRKEKVTENVVQKLKSYFMQGHTDIEACLLVGISRGTLNNYCKKNPEFYTIKEELKHKPAAIARNVVNKAIQEGDKDMAKWYLERKKKDEFSTRSETVGKDGGAIISEVRQISQEEITKRADEMRQA